MTTPNEAASQGDEFALDPALAAMIDDALSGVETATDERTFHLFDRTDDGYAFAPPVPVRAILNYAITAATKVLAHASDAVVTVETDPEDKVVSVDAELFNARRRVEIPQMHIELLTSFADILERTPTTLEESDAMTVLAASNVLRQLFVGLTAAFEEDDDRVSPFSVTMVVATVLQQELIDILA